MQHAQIIWRGSCSQSGSAVAARLGLDDETVRKRIHRYNVEGLDALKDRHRSGRLPTFTSEQTIPSTTQRVYVIMGNLSSHRTTDVLLFVLAHPRWEMVFQPKYAAYLDLIELWWKILRSLALADRRFDTWEEITDAIHRSTDFWNAHRHPFVWGQRRRHRHRPRRSPGIALLPRAA